MTVRIPIGADPSAAVQGFEAIRTAIQRAGQEGRRFEDLDLGHPELKEFADDIRKVRQQFDTLTRISGGLRGRLSAAGKFGKDDPWFLNFSKLYEDPRHAAQAEGRAEAFVTAGTRFEPSGMRSPGGGGGGSPGGAMGGMLGGVSGGSLGGMLKFGLGLAGIGGIAAIVAKAASQGSSEAIATDDLQRAINDTVTEFGTFEDRIRHLGKGLGVASTEAIQLASVFARASAPVTGSMDTVASSTRTAIGFARGFGGSPQQSAQFFGQMRSMGADRQGQRELARMIADAIAAGGMWSKSNEVMAQIAAFVQTSERTMVRSPNLRGYLAMSSAMNASDAPDLRGAAGAALINQIDAAIRGGGRFGEAGQMFMYRAVSREGGIDPFQMRLLREQGPFGTRASMRRIAGLPILGAPGSHLDGGKTTLQLITEEMRRRYANPLQRADASANLLGISMTQALELQRLKPSSFGSLGRLMERSNINIKDVKGSSFRELAGVATASNEDLLGLRSRYLGQNLTAPQRALIKGREGEDLRTGLAKIISDRGMIQSEGSQTRVAIAGVETTIGDLGTKLLEPLNLIREAVQKIAHPYDTAVDPIALGIADAAFGAVQSHRKIVASSPERDAWLAKNAGRSIPGQMPWVHGTTHPLPPQEVILKQELTLRHTDEYGRTRSVEHLPPAMIPLPKPGSTDSELGYGAVVVAP